MLRRFGTVSHSQVQVMPLPKRPGTCVGGVELVVPAAAIFTALPVSFLRLVIVRRPQPRAFEAATASPSRGEGRARQMTRTCKSLRVGGSAGSSC